LAHEDDSEAVVGGEAFVAAEVARTTGGGGADAELVCDGSIGWVVSL
jgi:hypothetical protein